LGSDLLCSDFLNHLNDLGNRSALASPYRLNELFRKLAHVVSPYVLFYSRQCVLSSGFFSATPILVNHFAVFATAWANFVVELLTSHLLAAALGEGQDFVDFVHFLFLFLSFFRLY
jgi:hypothetical protein